MLNFEPQTIDQLRMRFPAAVDLPVLMSQAHIDAHRPGNSRKHVLDCDDGLRLIVSAEIWDHADGWHEAMKAFPGQPVTRPPLVMHASASRYTWSKSEAAKARMNPVIYLRGMAPMIERRMVELSGWIFGPHNCIITPKGVVHLMWYCWSDKHELRDRIADAINNAKAGES